MDKEYESLVSSIRRLDDSGYRNLAIFDILSRGDMLYLKTGEELDNDMFQSLSQNGYSIIRKDVPFLIARKENIPILIEDALDDIVETTNVKIDRDTGILSIKGRKIENSIRDVDEILKRLSHLETKLLKSYRLVASNLIIEERSLSVYQDSKSTFKTIMFGTDAITREKRFML